MAARERVEFDVIGRDLGGSKAFRDVGDAADKAGDKIKDSGEKAKDTGVQYRGLAHEIEQVEGNVRRLAAEIDRTGNKDLFKDLRKQQSELRKLNRIQDLLPDVEPTEMSKQGIQAGEAFSGGFRGVLTSPHGLAVGGVLAAQLVPMLSAAVEGAVVGGIGVGGVIGGVALAARDSRVQAAGKQLGEAVMGDLDESAARFVSPTIQGIGIIRSAWSDVAGDVDSVFESTARYVEPLAQGVGDFVREIMPGIRQAAEAAGPIIREIGEGLPRIGAALGDMFSTFADDADEGASALRFVFMVVEEGIGFVGDAIHMFAGMYRSVLNVTDAAITMQEVLLGWNPIFKGPIADSRKKVDELKGALDRGGDAGADAGNKIAGGFQKADDKATDAVTALREWQAELDKMTGSNLSARQAQRDLEQSIDDATAAVKENGKTAINHGAALDINSAKGRANAAALDKIAKGANDAYDAVLAQTGSQELANQAAERGRAKFIELARKMGLSESAASALADELLRIKDRKVTVTANVQPALDSARSVVARINNMKARINVKAEVHGSFGGSAHTGFGYSTGYSAGGYVDGPGPKGVDSRRAMLAPGEGVLTAREVDALGGRAGFERLRATIRSGQPTASMAVASGSGPTAAGPSAEDFYRAMVRALQTVPVTRSDDGRMADIFSRGG